MAKKKGKKKGSGKMPLYSIAFSAKKGKNKYVRGPSLGMWKADSKEVVANGAVKDDRLTDLIKFLKKELKADHPIYIALFENKGKKGKRDSSSSDASSSDASSSDASSSDGSSSD